MARLASFKDALKQDPYEDAQALAEPVGEGSGTTIPAEPEPDTAEDSSQPAIPKPAAKKTPRTKLTGDTSSLRSAPRPQNQRPAVTSEPQRRGGALVEPPALPLYLQLQRKEARMRQEQVDDLEMLTKQINRRRSGTPEQRITDNTMIRIAIDLLLERRDELGGNSENELRESLGLPEVEY